LILLRRRDRASRSRSMVWGRRALISWKRLSGDIENVRGLQCRLSNPFEKANVEYRTWNFE